MKGHFKGCSTPDNCWCEAKRFLGLFVITLGVFVLEIVAGFAIGSLALVADAFHVLTDNVVILVALSAVVIIKLNATARPTQVRIWAFYLSIGLLGATMLGVAREAFDRLFSSPQEIESGIVMAVVALVGLGGNLLQRHIHKGAPEKHQHKLHRSISLHIDSDAILSVAVIVGGILISITEWVTIDPLLTIGVVGWTYFQIVKILLDKNKSDPPHAH